MKSGERAGEISLDPSAASPPQTWESESGASPWLLLGTLKGPFLAFWALTGAGLPNAISRVNGRDL